MTALPLETASALHDSRADATHLQEALRQPDLVAAQRCGLKLPYLIRPRASDCRPGEGHDPLLVRALRELLTAQWDTLHAEAGGQNVLLRVRNGPAVSAVMLIRNAAGLQIDQQGPFTLSQERAIRAARTRTSSAAPTPSQ